MAKTKIKEVKTRKRSKAAFVLVFIATLILLINALLVMLLKNQLTALLQQLGFAITSGELVTSGVIWFVLAVLIWFTTQKIEIKAEKQQKWFLFVLSIITMIAGRLESGVLALIAAIIYLRQK